MLVTSIQEMSLFVSIIFMPETITHEMSLPTSSIFILVTITQEMLSHQGDQYHTISNCYHYILIGMPHGPIYKPPGQLVGCQYCIRCHR